jgi:hypothetical protein
MGRSGLAVRAAFTRTDTINGRASGGLDKGSAAERKAVVKASGRSEATEEREERGERIGLFDWMLWDLGRNDKAHPQRACVELRHEVSGLDAGGRLHPGVAPVCRLALAIERRVIRREHETGDDQAGARANSEGVAPIGRKELKSPENTGVSSHLWRSCRTHSSAPGVPPGLFPVKISTKGSRFGVFGAGGLPVYENDFESGRSG